MMELFLVKTSSIGGECMWKARDLVGGQVSREQKGWKGFSMREVQPLSRKMTGNVEN